jgi:hypothetical protein
MRLRPPTRPPKPPATMILFGSIKNNSKKSELLTQLLKGLWLFSPLKIGVFIKKMSFRQQKTRFSGRENGFRGDFLDFLGLFQ